MAEARVDEEEEELRELREPGVRRNARQSSPATGRSERNKPDRRLSSQGPLSSIRSAIKRTTTRSNSESDSRERRRPEITILSAEPLAANAWFPGASAGFPPPPPPTDHIWGGSIPAAAQPPPSYDQVIREKTQEQAPPPDSTPKLSTTTTIATQTDLTPEAVTSDLQCSVTSEAVEKKASPARRPPKPPRPSFPVKPRARPSDAAENSSDRLGESSVFPSQEQTVTNVHAAQAINSLIDSSGEFLSSSLTSGSHLQTDPCEPCLISLDFPSTSTATSSALPPSSQSAANGQPQEDARRPTPRPRSKPDTKEVKVQTLVRLRDYGENVQVSQSGGDVSSGKYLQELLDIFGSGDQFLSGQSEHIGESDQSKQNDLGDESEEDDMSALRTKIQAFEKQGGADEADGEPVKRPEPRPRAQQPKPPPIAARPPVPSKPSLAPRPSDKGFWDKGSTPGPKPETNNPPTPAPRPLLPKKCPAENDHKEAQKCPTESDHKEAQKCPTENDHKEAPASLTRPPRPSVAARPKNPVARDEGCAVGRPAPPVQPNVPVDLLDFSCPPIVTVATETGPDCENIKTASDDVTTKQEQPLVTFPDRPSVPQKPTVNRVSGKTGKSGSDGSAEPAPPLPAQDPVGGLAPPVAPKTSVASKSTTQHPSTSPPQPPAEESSNCDRPGGSVPLPPRPLGGHPLYNSYTKKNGAQVPSERTDSADPECHAGEAQSRVQSSSTKTSAPLVDTSSSSEPQVMPPKTSAPLVDTSSSSEPQVMPPKTSASLVDTSSSSEPQVMPPKTSASLVDTSSSSEPQVMSPKTSAPLVDTSSSSEPQVIPPKTIAPLVDISSSSEPQVMPPKTSAPLVDTSSSSEPEKPAPKQPRRESSGLQVQVLHDFTPEGPNELGLRAGDMVSMVERVDSDWFRGTCRGSSGIFPVNHVKTLSSAPANGNKEELVAVAVSSGPRCVARFDYEAEQGDELSFSEGAVIGLKEYVDQEWVRGEIGGQTGIFPLNFVDVVEDLPAAEVPQSIQKKTEPSGSATSLQNQEAAKSGQSEPAEEEWVLALFDFNGQTEEDLSFKQGARILITKHVDSDWCCGKLDGKQGLFPKAFVQINCAGRGCNNQSGIHR
ncbi:hypothetical protein SKAU_G00039780 [Synaphobranchus kaupii]|uniref:SH3 domain-containing protein n=1 Tax=Synaphobranchus kaupii TaxID=118154 RepID=A0A9Q1GH97_SYNKA|nr:hypothetical protein SKAU_G00039780 [Synaphobranchus kaupii]